MLSSHSSKLHVNWGWDVLSLKVKIQISREHCSLSRELDKYIFRNMVLNYRNFCSYNYYSISWFVHGHNSFHLDNPDPGSVERETISNPNPKNPNIRPDWTPNPDPVHHWCLSNQHSSFLFRRTKSTISRIQFSARYKTELENISLPSMWSSGKWLDNHQFEWLLCCIWVFFWCTYTRL